ncbi:addiction module toxin RelE [Candidatus Kaiserbacteria bacterium CG10_big_fil_rev_8_21_14_0_10_51_14]|uniref:Addiction module toxin RelE n=1 Tax=Candidatus Kaiserbacteria bacterium CG10_big_fil_rev_8_21_14_0_10_51_14 TaxID=1974610 RepID=A0A2H0UEL7_9BACT|nr:MAG: addiction module toxin RelE [Candidatus Kaiserbacteria bacterium CG10_big_fil_rev_8_21_14_0_10_51_14]
MLVLNLDTRARRFVKKLPPKQFGQVDRKLAGLLAFPFPHDSKHLKGLDWYRVDVGEYRIIYNVRGNVLDVPLIGKRNDDEVYKKLKRMG